MKSEISKIAILKHPPRIQNKASFRHIRYAQCWEDADVLLEGLKIKPGAKVLSIASAGDNTFSILSQGASEVIAIDLNPAQLACTALRKAAYRTLTHKEFLRFLGVRSYPYRKQLYQRCRTVLDESARKYWDSHQGYIQSGFATVGKFEGYFSLFRNLAMPFVHSQSTISKLLQPRFNWTKRAMFYEGTWNNFRWRMMFRLFFSRFVMGLFGRSPAFFQYVKGSVAERLLKRAYFALVNLVPSENPYLHWILTGTYGENLPHALREENFNKIRANLGALKLVNGSIEDYLASNPGQTFDAWNLSDIFEYMSEEQTRDLLTMIAEHTSPQGRLLYWNMLVPRSSNPKHHPTLRSLPLDAARLFNQDKAFFYSAIQLEERI